MTLAHQNRSREGVDVASFVTVAETLTVKFREHAAVVGVLMPVYPLQQAFRDVSAINVHGFLGHETNEQAYGALMMGDAMENLFLWTDMPR